MKIGELAERAGLNSSAVRYYESIGLLAPAVRVGGQRRYTEEALHRALLIRFASDMGFTLSEIKLFLSDLGNEAPVGPRWRKLASRKIAEVEASIERARRLKLLLSHLLGCRCTSLKMCVERLSLSPNARQLGGRRRGRKPSSTDRLPASD
jgi:MerR family redox-sensitive transcriptional activator SoxR